MNSRRRPASRGIKLGAVQARLYVERAGDAEDRKSAGCAVSPVLARIASLHHLAALSRAADAPYTAVPRFSTRPSVSAGLRLPSRISAATRIPLRTRWILPEIVRDLQKSRKGSIRRPRGIATGESTMFLPVQDRDSTFLLSSE